MKYPIFFFAMVLGCAFVSVNFAQGRDSANSYSSECRPEKALGGDSSAAKSCAIDHLNGDQAQFVYWTQIAAENGDAVSQYNLAIILLNTKKQQDRLRAIFWLKKSADSGYALAVRLLSEIRSKPNATFPEAPPKS